MSKVEAETQHRCSCGRTFRHGISLKRHQKVSGCAQVELPAGKLPPASAKPAAADSAPARPAALLAPEESIGSPTVIVTAEQIARWQKEKMLGPCESAQSEPPPAIDWKALKETALDFAEFSVDCGHAGGRALGSMLVVAARFGLFGTFLVALGWVLLFGISTDLMAAPSHGLTQTESARLAAESTVTSFLQTSRLGQIERARGYLSVQVRDTVSADELRQLLDALPLGVNPERVSAELEQSGQTAKVTVHRSGQAEVYTLVRESRGWGLASVALRRS